MFRINKGVCRRDVIVAQSHVLDTIEKTTNFLKYRQTPLLMRNTGKEFQNISFGAGEAFKIDLSARGMACGDLDNDGETDCVISQNNGIPVILRNNGTKNHWVGVVLKGGMSPLSGEGSRVIVTDSNGRKQVFDVSGSGSYISANDPRIIAGLGAALGVRSIEIRWTSGRQQKIENPPIDRYQIINEPK